MGMCCKLKMKKWRVKLVAGLCQKGGVKFSAKHSGENSTEKQSMYLEYFSFNTSLLDWVSKWWKVLFFELE